MKIIVTANEDYVIGQDGKFPWRYKEVFKRFKDLTTNQTILMGGATFNNLFVSTKNLRNVVLTRRPLVESKQLVVFSSYEAAVSAYPNCWVIGGGELFKRALLDSATSFVDLTRVPDPVPVTSSTTIFPKYLLRRHFELADTRRHPYHGRLQLERYERKP